MLLYTRVVYYDLTNYFFECEEEQGLIQYGHSKEGRPLPIVQMGLFMVKDGFYGICTDLEGSAPEIIGTLRDMNFLSVNGEGYVPTYTRTDLTNNLHGSAGFRTSYRLHIQKKY